MFDNLQKLGLGIVIFAVIIGVGTVVLQNFGSATAGCNTSYPWNATSGTCMNTSGSSLAETGSLTNTKYLQTQLGTSGLAGWAPAVIALSIGLLFIGAFMFKRSGKGRY